MPAESGMRSKLEVSRGHVPSSRGAVSNARGGQVPGSRGQVQGRGPLAPASGRSRQTEQERLDGRRTDWLICLWMNGLIVDLLIDLLIDWFGQCTCTTLNVDKSIFMFNYSWLLSSDQNVSSKLTSARITLKAVLWIRIRSNQHYLAGSGTDPGSRKGSQNKGDTILFFVTF